jgi:hypothetical protein
MTFVTRPSSLPAQAKSPRWESSGSSVAAEAGNDRHTALEELFHGKRQVYELLAEHEQEAVLWAYDYVRSVITPGSTIQNEIGLEVRRGAALVLRGTADVVVGDNLFDLKWTERNYNEQMAAYALGVMQLHGFPKITVHIMYGDTKRVQRYEITREEAEGLVYPILDAVANPNTPCKASEYCSWCKHHATCPVIVGHVNTVATGLQMVPLDEFHLATLDNVAKALNLAEVAKEWADAVQEKARNLAVQGFQIPGYTLKERSGAREIDPTLINHAFERLGLPQEVFLAACKVSITKLVDAMAKTGMPKKQANQTVNDRLMGLVETKPSTRYLTKNK